MNYSDQQFGNDFAKFVSREFEMFGSSVTCVLVYPSAKQLYVYIRVIIMLVVSFLQDN